MDLRAMLDNQFLSGGLVLGMFGGAIVFARQYAKKVGQWLFRQGTISIELRNTDEPFHWLLAWLDGHPYAKRARRLVVSLGPSDRDAPSSSDQDVSRAHPRLVFSPAVGQHFFTYHGRLVWLIRDREPAGTNNFRERETCTVRMMGRSQSLLRQLLDDAYDAYVATIRRQSRIFTPVWNSWAASGTVRPRSLDSVILPGNQKAELLADLERFVESEQWYHELGIPYRRGYLLSGIPGSGKTSLVAALANHLGLHLYLVYLSGLKDKDLHELLHNIQAPRGIVLFEDIDSAKVSQVRDENGEEAPGVSLSGLLNALDGVGSRDGYITVLTTNRREVLDAALTRAGRVDMELDFGPATPDQAAELYRRFYGDEAARRHSMTVQMTLRQDVSMATLQNHFLVHRDEPALGARLTDLASWRGMRKEA